MAALSTMDRQRKPFVKATMMALRRLHLYFGLLLFPWAILYGVTAFLFNHPGWFSDQKAISYGKETTRGTAVESLATPNEIAEQFIKELNRIHQPATPYTIAGEAKFNREFSFATVKAEGQTVSLLIDAKHGTGSIRTQANQAPKPDPEPAPFANGPTRKAQGNREQGPAVTPKADPANAIVIDRPLHDRFKEAIPSILERHQLPLGEITVTSVPDIVVPVTADGKTWIATYNPMTGSVTGQTNDHPPANEFGWRRFLLRLHTAHGYPGEINSRWAWAVVVDLMAFVLCFWGVSGLVMWWQLKQQRKLGIVLLTLSAVTATALGVAMSTVMR